MVPSLLGVIVLTAGLVLIHFGLKEVESILGSTGFSTTPYLSQPAPSGSNPGQASGRPF